MKQGTASVGVLATGAAMFLVAAALLGLTLLICGGARRGETPWRWLLLIGFLGAAINVLVLVAFRFTSVANVATLSRTDVLFSMLIATLLLGVRPDWRVVLFVPVMLLGIGTLTGMLTRKPQFGNPGDFLVIAAALGVSVNAFIIKRVVQKTSGLLVGAVNCAINAALFLLALWVMNPPGAITGDAIRTTWPSLLFLGALSYLFFVGYYEALRAIPVWEALLMFLAMPVIAVLFGWVWLQEVPTAHQWAGIALVSAGAAGIILLRRPVPSLRVKENVG